MEKTKQKSPWSWIPTLYFAEGLPYVVVMSVATILYKNLEISNTEIALYTSWLYLPWVIKPLWSPIVDVLKTKRWWIVLTQSIIGIALALVAFTLPSDFFFQASIAALWLLAFTSATHDIAADGFYMLALDDGDQAFYVGIRSTFYRAAMFFGEGFIVMIVGFIVSENANKAEFAKAWQWAFLILMGVMLLCAIYHFIFLPKPQRDKSESESTTKDLFIAMQEAFVAFFQKKNILIVLIFILFFRFAEAQLVKIAPLFLLDSFVNGGMALSNEALGFVNGTVGLIALTLGGILGGIVVSRNGLKYWLWWFVLAINIPNLGYLILSMFQPDSLVWVNVVVAIEKFGYGFGFTALLLYMIYATGDSYKTAHYAFFTGFMALGMMIPGMFSGYLQELLGYQNFFIWVMIATIPSFLVSKLIPLDSEYGKKDDV